MPHDSYRVAHIFKFYRIAADIGQRGDDVGRNGDYPFTDVNERFVFVSRLAVIVYDIRIIFAGVESGNAYRFQTFGKRNARKQFIAEEATVAYAFDALRNNYFRKFRVVGKSSASYFGEISFGGEFNFGKFARSVKSIFTENFNTLSYRHAGKRNRIRESISAYCFYAVGYNYGL